MVLIQLLLPTSGAAGGEGLAQLAETRQELADRIQRPHGVVCDHPRGMVDRT
jgi:hypothetical protein